MVARDREKQSTEPSGILCTGVCLSTWAAAYSTCERERERGRGRGRGDSSRNTLLS